MKQESVEDQGPGTPDPETRTGTATGAPDKQERSELEEFASNMQTPNVFSALSSLQCGWVAQGATRKSVSTDITTLVSYPGGSIVQGVGRAIQAMSGIDVQVVVSWRFSRWPAAIELAGKHHGTPYLEKGTIYLSNKVAQTYRVDGS